MSRVYALSMNDIMDSLEEMGLGTQGCPADFVIQGGYYDAAVGIDWFSKSSLELSLRLGEALLARYAHNRVSHDILVNDLGANCTVATCDADKEIAVQQGGVASLLECLAPAQRVVISITSERHMRNVGLRRAKKLLRESTSKIHCIDEGSHQLWVLRSIEGHDDIVLFEDHGTSRVARCPIIMGAYYDYLIRRDRSNVRAAATRVVIDLCSVLDKHKVRKGAEVALRLLLRGTPGDVIMPVLCDEACEVTVPIPVRVTDFC